MVTLQKSIKERAAIFGKGEWDETIMYDIITESEYESKKTGKQYNL